MTKISYPFLRRAETGFLCTGRRENIIKILINIFVVVALGSSTIAFADDGIENAGDVLHVVLPVTAMSYTLVSGDKDGRMQFIKSAAMANGLTRTLKRALNHERPNGRDYSFPSGHTTYAFFGAAFSQRRYGWKVGLPAYALATFVGYSRIESDNHYLRDVIAGAAIGTGSVYLFTKPQKNLEIMPYFNGDESGVKVQIKW